MKQKDLVETMLKTGENGDYELFQDVMTYVPREDNNLNCLCRQVPGGSATVRHLGHFVAAWLICWDFLSTVSSPTTPKNIVLCVVKIFIHLYTFIYS